MQNNTSSGLLVHHNQCTQSFSSARVDCFVIVHVIVCVGVRVWVCVCVQVDIFTLGSCLYEIMTLNHLPPGKMSQPEYKSMLASGRRAQITPKVS